MNTKIFRIRYVIVLIFCMGFSLGVLDVIPKGTEKLSIVKEVQAAGGIANNGLGGININIYGSPYTDFRNFSMGQYAYTASGCAWFASARVNQLTGQGTTIRAGTNWWRNAASLGYSRGQELRAPAIACWGNHVAIVEKIEGNIIYLSEGGHTGYPNNGYTRIGTVPSSYFSTNDKGNWLGFVYLPGATTNTDTAAPAITNVAVSDVTFDGYTVTCTVADNTGVTSVKFPSWCSDTHAGGDADWLEGTVSGGMASVRVNVAALKSGGCQGNYITHIYAYDAAGNSSSFGLAPVFIDRTPPEISNARVLEADNTGYTISCTATDNNQVTRVLFPTWTAKNGQDDLAKDWDKNSSVQGTREGNVYTFRVNDSEHNYERGEYITHIYAYDEHKNWSLVKIPGIEINNTYQPVNTVTWSDHTYMCYEDLLSWHEALNYAKTLSGHLVTITSQEENDIVEALIRSGKRDAYFIGLTDDKQEEHPFRWENGEEVTYTNWREGEPNDYVGIEDCAAILSGEEEAGKWNDIPGEYRNTGFVVEIPSAPESTTSPSNPTTPSAPLNPVTGPGVSSQTQQQPQSSSQTAAANDSEEAPTTSQKSFHENIGYESEPVSSKKITVYIGSAKRKKVTIKCRKLAGAKGYQIQYSKNKSFKKAKNKTTYKTSCIIKDMKNRKNLYIRIRAFKKSGKSKKYGKWSAVKKICLK